MGIIENVKSVVMTIQQIDNVELYKKILDLQTDVQNLVGENSELKRGLADLKAKFQIKEKLAFDRDAYWIPQESKPPEGPFCSLCWDSKRELIRMLKCGNPTFSECPRCKRGVQMEPDADDINASDEYDE